MNKNELKLAVEAEIKNIKDCKRIKVKEEAEARVSLLVENMDTNEVLLSYYAEETMLSASIIKVVIMLAALELVQEGKWSTKTRIEMKDSMILEDSSVFEFGSGEYTLDELLVWMIINSDNSATNCLIELISMERVNALCKALGLKNTKLERRMLDFEAAKLGFNNVTSAHDMSIVYKAMYHKSILTAELCDYAISILKRQRHKQLSMRYISDEVVVAHKTGSLECLKHDVGIFYLEGVHYYFGAFVSGAPSDVYAKQWIGRISKLIYEYYKEWDEKTS